MAPATTATRRNLELKARDRDPARSLQVCRDLGAEDRGVLVQRDTYFTVPRGRLKLREEPGVEATLIAYARPDVTGHKESRYRLVPVPDPAELTEALSTTLGIRVVVTKQRHLFIHDAVRIHLDQVDNLGTFIEFEAVVPPGESPRHFESLLAELREAFGIEDSDLVPSSYADLRRAAS